MFSFQYPVNQRQTNFAHYEVVGTTSVGFDN